jgi:hypothetical protein
MMDAVSTSKTQVSFYETIVQGATSQKTAIFRLQNGYAYIVHGEL